MCGICGIVHLNKNRPVAGETLQAMCDSIHHRGPDEDGYYLYGPVGLGMRRLSIIDLSGGSQPIFNEDHSLAIIFNGEIYNYLELKRELEQAGHQFATRSDTEVILHAYEQWGADCPNHLRGMFAFALHNTQTGALFLARDRMGKKPLYYYQDAAQVIFASEIKALFTCGDVPRRLNLEALDAYLSLGYVPAPSTLFAGIYKLPAGSSMTIRDGQISVREYWDLKYEQNPACSFEEAKRELQRLLTEAVEVRLMSEVPLGAFLSGGIDSSVIVALMSRILARPVNTFSVGFEDKDQNELPYARIAAEAFHTDHHELMLTACTPELLERIVYHLDEPVADPAAVPTLLVSELARRHVTVVLTGEGGDELFAGYDYYRQSEWARRYEVLPEGLSRQVLPALARGYNSLTGRQRYHERTIWHWSLPPATRLGAWVSIFTQADQDRLYAPGFARASAGHGLDSFGQYYERARSADFLHRLLYVDSRVWLPDDLLMKVDKMSMAHSLEARAPYLDHKLFEFVATLPPAFKLHNGVSKYIFKEVALELLPAEIVNRPKHTFDVPIGKWLNGSLRDLTRELVADGRVAGMQLFDPAYIGGPLYQGLEQNRPGAARQVWTLLNLALWAKKYNVTV